jgi:gliding motility-associated-like protein
MVVPKFLGVFIVLWLSTIKIVFGQCDLTVTLSSSNNGVICSGNSITLTVIAAKGTGPYIYAWSTGETTSTINVNKGNTYTVTVTDQTAGCQAVTKSITVTEATTPNAPTVANAIACPNTTVSLQATGPGGVYQWYDAPVAGNFLYTGDTFTTTPLTATTTYYVDATVGGCTGPRAAVTVNLSGGPTVTDTQICAGNTATLLASGGSSYTWYDSPAGNPLAQGNIFTTTPLTSTTTFYVVAVVNGCTSAPTPVTVNVIPYPQAPVPDNVAPICSSGSANLHATGTGTIDWFDVPTGGTSLITSPDYTTPGLSVTTTYYVQNSTNGCSSPRVPVIVIVNPVPDAPVVQPQVICSGNSAILSASSVSGGTYNWYADAQGTYLTTGNTFTTPVLTTTTTYYVQTINNGCGSSIIPVLVTVNDTPPAPTVTVTPVCQGTPATLTAITPGGIYEWFDVSTGGIPLYTGDTFVTPNLTTNTTYYVQTTVNSCTSTRTAVTATLLPIVTPPTANDAAICVGSSTTIIASGASNYQWYDAATGGNLLTAGKVLLIPPLTATTTYYVQTTTNGCASTRTPVTVTVNPIPVQPTVSGTTTICPGATATLTATAPAGSTINWYNAATGGTKVGTGFSFTTPTIFSTTTYYAENTGTGCNSARSAVTVSTVQIVYPQFSYTSATSCKTGPNVIPTINDAAGGVFSAAPAGLVFANTTTGEIDISASTPGKYTITFVGNEACHGVTQSTMYIVLLPDAHFSYTGPFCQYASVNPSPVFTGLSSGGVITSSSANLVFSTVGLGVIDLQNSKPGTYTITNTIPASGTCPQAIETTSVTIVSGVAVNAGPDQTVNGGTQAQLNGTITGVPGGKWTTSGTGTFDNANSKNAIYTAGTGEVSATLTLTSDLPAGNCGAVSDNMEVTFIPPPSAPIAASTFTCVNSSVTLSATQPGGNYEWYDAATGGNLVATGPNFTTNTLTVSTTYYVQTTVANVTSNRTAVNVTVNPIPATPTVTSSVITCSNTSVALTAQGSTGSYEWYDAATGGSKLAAGNTFNTPLITSSIPYFVQAIAGGCASVRARVDVVMTPSPVITSPATATICASTPVSYTIASNIATASYTWARPQVAGISNAAVAAHASNSINETLNNTGTTSVKVIYNITATANGCTTNFLYTVTVFPSANVISPAKASVCNGEALNYTIIFNKPGTNFNWSRAAVTGINNTPISGQGSSSIKETLFNTTNLPIDVTYIINYALGNCIDTFNYIVTVNPAVVITSAPYQTSCSGTPLNYTITSNASAATFVWSRSATPNISNTAGSGQTSLINESLNNTSTNTVNVVYTISPTVNGCTGAPFYLFIDVRPTQLLPLVNTNTPVCTGSTIHLQTPLKSGASYLWTGPNGFTSAQQNPDITNATLANAGTYSLTTVINGCASPAGTANVVINTPATVNAGADQVICVTQKQVNLSGNVSGGTSTGIWATNGTGSFSPTNGQLNTQYIPSQQDLIKGAVTLSLASTSKDDCTINTDDVVITFAPTPAVDAGPDEDVCSQSTVIQLTGKLLKPGTAIWTTSGSGTFSPSANQINANYIPSASDIANGTLTLVLTYQNAGICDIATDNVVIKFTLPPTLNAGGSRYVLLNHTITLQPTVSDNNVTYLWTPNIGLDDNTAKNPVVTGDIDRVYTLTITDSKGCTAQDKAQITVSPELAIYNTFTPNGDGINDFWVIPGLIAYVDAVVDVFDRAGSNIYHSIGYTKPWDGTYNGKPLIAGTYYYVIKLNFNGQILSGPVTIIK